MTTSIFGITTADVALSVEHCPVANGTAEKNELGQDCAECLSGCPERAMLCDALECGEYYDISEELDVLFPVLYGWEDRVMRRVGL
ncbi:MAG: hypothetical protein OXI23_20670 [Gemmatimonadota bacterium]|nr:hypothetical protein [Gemmatimonadota bacterium]